MAEVLSIVPKPEPPKAPFCQTPTAQDIADVLVVCQSRADFGVIVGEPGVGKTTAATNFSREHRYVWLVTMTPATSPLVPCLDRIAWALGALPMNTGAMAARQVIVEKIESARRCALADGEGGVLLVIDEAQHLSDAAVEEIRSIYDETPFGLVLVGNRGLIDRWAAKPGAKRTAWAQLTSRIGQQLDIPSVTEEDIAAFCDHHDIRNKSIRSLFYKKAQGIGGLRSTTKLLADAQALAGAGRRVEVQHIEQAERLRGPARGG